jgi:CDP-glucose 4,6-dehydratase
MNRLFWQGKKVLITGHTGFKGSWLSLWLQSWGAQVVGYSLAPPTTPSLFERAQVEQGMDASHLGDIRDLEHLIRVFEQTRPEIVFHMAAQPLVLYSYEQPVETYATNVMGTVNVLEAARQVGGVRAFVNITSDKCYENREWIWGYRENDPMGGYDPYSSSKGCAELVTSAYRQSFFNPADYDRHGLALASVRTGNVIGGGDWARNRLVPDVLHAFSMGEKVTLRSPNAVRPWQHVLEPLSGYLMLAERLWTDGPAYSDSWNFGPAEKDARSVQWIVERLAMFWGQEAQWALDAGTFPHEANYLKLDCSKAASRLRWQPALDLEQALEWIVAWHRAYLAGDDLRACSLSQIEAYQAAASQH